MRLAAAFPFQLETEPTALMNGVDLIVFQIARMRIERGDWAWAAHRFNADPMPIPQLHAWFGRVVWCFAGYDSDSTELYAIQEVRRFLAAWRRCDRRCGRTGSPG